MKVSVDREHRELRLTFELDADDPCSGVGQGGRAIELLGTRFRYEYRDYAAGTRLPAPVYRGAREFLKLAARGVTGAADAATRASERHAAVPVGRGLLRLGRAAWRRAPLSLRQRVWQGLERYR